MWDVEDGGRGRGMAVAAQHVLIRVSWSFRYHIVKLPQA